MAKRNLDKIEIVVGIDFGTSYSTYAYSYAYDQNKIFMNSDWPSGSKACKEMTAILFNGDKEFIAFGEDAVEKFNYSSDEEEKSWLFFNKFKMALYNEKVSYIIVEYLEYYDIYKKSTV